MDWQPYDHAGWRLTVPDVGLVAAAADLEAVDGGTRLRIRWDSQGEAPIETSVANLVRVEREAALARLATLVTGSLPVVN